MSITTTFPAPSDSPLNPFAGGATQTADAFSGSESTVSEFAELLDAKPAPTETDVASTAIGAVPSAILGVPLVLTDRTVRTDASLLLSPANTTGTGSHDQGKVDSGVPQASDSRAENVTLLTPGPLAGEPGLRGTRLTLGRPGQHVAHGGQELLSSKQSHLLGHSFQVKRPTAVDDCESVGSETASKSARLAGDAEGSSPSESKSSNCPPYLPSITENTAQPASAEANTPSLVTSESDRIQQIAAGQAAQLFATVSNRVAPASPDQVDPGVSSAEARRGNGGVHPGARPLSLGAGVSTESASHALRLRGGLSNRTAESPSIAGRFDSAQLGGHLGAAELAKAPAGFDNMGGPTQSCGGLNRGDGKEMALANGLELGAPTSEATVRTGRLGAGEPGVVASTDRSETFAGGAPTTPAPAALSSPGLSGVVLHSLPAEKTSRSLSVDSPPALVPDAEQGVQSKSVSQNAGRQRVVKSVFEDGIEPAKKGVHMSQDSGNSRAPALMGESSSFPLPAGVPDLVKVEAAQSTESTSASRAAQAVEVVRHVADVAEGVWSAERSGVNLKLQIDDVRVAVRVELKEGQVHVSVRTDSPELRDALSQAWSAQNPTGRAVPFAEPVFTSSTPGAFSLSTSNTPSFSSAGGDASRQHSQSQQQGHPHGDARGHEFGAFFSQRGGASASAPHVAAPRAVARENASNARLNAFA